MKRVKKQRSVLPVYLIAIWWAIGGFAVRIHTISQFATWIVLSVAIFVVGKLIWPDRTVELPPQEQENEPVEEAVKAEPAQPEDPEVAALRQERDRAVGEMRRLNDSIEDPVVSAQIDHIEATTGKIFAYVMTHPDRKGQIRRFLNYYLPTTIKLLNAYDRLDDAGISGANIDGAKGKISELMTTIVAAFDKQLDALFQGEVMDINAEIKVLESLLTGDGLVDKPMA